MVGFAFILSNSCSGGAWSLDRPGLVQRAASRCRCWSGVCALLQGAAEGCFQGAAVKVVRFGAAARCRCRVPHDGAGAGYCSKLP